MNSNYGREGQTKNLIT